jgi:hypothetical protein
MSKSVGGRTSENVVFKLDTLHHSPLMSSRNQCHGNNHVTSRLWERGMAVRLLAR